MKREQRCTLALFLIYLLLLTWVILFKLQRPFTPMSHFRSVNWIPLAGSVVINGQLHVSEIVDNVLVFLPVGMYVGMLKPNWPFVQKVCPAFLLSLCYESLQYVFAIGTTDVTDLISNTLGGALGVLLLVPLEKALQDRTVRVLNRVAFTCTVLASALFGFVSAL